MKKLYKTTVVIWSEYDPKGTELEDLAHDATEGESYCSSQKTVLVRDPEKDPDWDGTEFFQDGEIGEDEEGV
jgi:hypothetical protein